MKPICSVLIPTRQRVEKLSRSLHLLCETANAEKFEIIVRCHHSDKETSESAPSLLSRFKNLKVIFGGDMEGYESLGDFYQEAADSAIGEWCWFFNDDAFIESKVDWLDRLSMVPTGGFICQPQTIILNQSVYPNWQGGNFPIVLNGCWNGKLKLKRTVDVDLDIFLRHEMGYKTRFIDGLVVRHDREIDKILPKERF